MQENNFGKDIERFFEWFGKVPHYDITFIGDFGLKIIRQYDKSEFTIRFEQIKKVRFLMSGNVQFEMNNGSFLYIERFRDHINVGL